jgi:hypothetical protein
MRDPARIEPILWKLRQVWERDPDLRLGQLIANAAPPADLAPGDFFNVEDEGIERGLDRPPGDDAERPA